MDPQIIPLFSTPLYKGNVNYNQDIDLEKIDYKRYTYNNGFGSKNKEILLTREFHSLKKQIDKHVEIYLFKCLELSQGRIRHIRSWINLHQRGDYAQTHIHANSFISGILYLKVPFEEDGGGRICFMCPESQPTFKTSTINPDRKNHNLFNSNVWGFIPAIGDLYLFPSHTHHYTDANKSTEGRYALSFNYFLEGSFGEKDAIEYLEL